MLPIRCDVFDEQMLANVHFDMNQRRPADIGFDFRLHQGSERCAKLLIRALLYWIRGLDKKKRLPLMIINK